MAAVSEVCAFLEERGGIVSRPFPEDIPCIRHFGSPRDEYRAASQACGLVCRTDRTLLRIHGRAPARMLHGVLTNSIPDAPAGSPVVHGLATYGTMLTAKGRMVTDLRTVWLGRDEADGLGLDVAMNAHAATLGHLSRFLPPRMARVEDLSHACGLVTVLGPEAETTLARLIGGVAQHGYMLIDGGPVAGGLLVVASLEQLAGWDIWGSPASLKKVWSSLEGFGARGVGWGVWDTLRIEAGLPAFGVDMDQATIPVEAGLLDRAFDHKKGCYTGQEVIVRIRDRGRVNWNLRALRFGDADAQPGAQLFEPGGGKVRGRVTSVAQSPRFRQTIGLGYVRRECEPPTTLRLGSSDGHTVAVEALG